MKNYKFNLCFCFIRNQRPKKNDFKNELGEEMQHTSIKEEIDTHLLNAASVEGIHCKIYFDLVFKGIGYSKHLF